MVTLRVLGLDVGEKTIGVAVSDELGWTAQSVTTLRRKSRSADLGQLEELVRRLAVEEIVVGLPRNMNGTLGPGAQKAQALGEELRQRLGLPVYYWDERLSTVAAERVLLEADLSRRRRRQVIDSVAASVILQGFLEYRRNGCTTIL